MPHFILVRWHTYACVNRNHNLEMVPEEMKAIELQLNSIVTCSPVSIFSDNSYPATVCDSNYPNYLNSLVANYQVHAHISPQEGKRAYKRLISNDIP